MIVAIEVEPPRLGGKVWAARRLSPFEEMRKDASVEAQVRPMPVELAEAEALGERLRDDAPFSADELLTRLKQPPRQVVEPWISDLPVAGVREVRGNKDALNFIGGDERGLGQGADCYALLRRLALQQVRRPRLESAQVERHRQAVGLHLRACLEVVDCRTRRNGLQDNARI